MPRSFRNPAPRSHRRLDHRPVPVVAPRSHLPGSRTVPMALPSWIESIEQPGPTRSPPKAAKRFCNCVLVPVPRHPLRTDRSCISKQCLLH